METSDRLEVCVGLLLLLLLLFLSLGKEYRIYSKEKGKKGAVTNVTNPAPNIAKCLHERD